MNTPNERLLFFRKSVLKQSRREFCEPLVMTDGELRNIEDGKTDLKPKYVRHLADVYGLNPEWLTDGTEPIQLPRTPDEIASIAHAAAYLSDDEIRRQAHAIIDSIPAAQLKLFAQLLREGKILLPQKPPSD